MRRRTSLDGSAENEGERLQDAVSELSSSPDLHCYIDQQADNYKANHACQNPENFVGLVVLLREAFARGIKSTPSAVLEFIHLHSPLHDHGVIQLLFGRTGGGSARGCIGFQTHLDLAEAQDLAGL